MYLRAIALLLLCLYARATMAAPADDGGALYAARCAACHDNPHDRIPPRLTLSRLWPEQVQAALTTGPMRSQATGLTPSDIRALTVFLTHKEPSAVAIDPDANLCSKPAGPIDLGGSAWNGWGRDPENTRYQPDPGLAAADVPRLRLKWAFAYPGGETIGQPVIVGGKVFVTAVSGRVFALDAWTGCTYWSYAAAGPVRGALTIGPSGKDGNGANLIYFGDMLGTVYAIDESGRPVWKAKPESHPLVQIRGTPKLYQGRLYVPISSNEETASGDPAYPCCTFRGAVVALDAANGSVIWKGYTIAETPAKIGKNSAGTDSYGPSGASVWNSPTIDEKRRRLYVGTGNAYSAVDNEATDAVMAFDLDTGKRLWVTQGTAHDTWIICPKPGTGNCPAEIGPDFDFGSSPVLRTAPDGKQIVIAGQKSGAVYAFDPDNGGKLLWRTQVGFGGAYGGVEHGVASEGNRVYVAISDVMATVPVDPQQLKPHQAGGMSALNILTGELLWHTPAPGPVCSWGKESCFAAQPGSITVIPGIVFSGSLDGHVRAYATANGAIVWTFDTAQTWDAVNGAKAKGGAVKEYGPIVAGGMLYVNSGGGYHGPPGNALLALSVDGK